MNFLELLIFGVVFLIGKGKICSTATLGKKSFSKSTHKTSLKIRCTMTMPSLNHKNSMCVTAMQKGYALTVIFLLLTSVSSVHARNWLEAGASVIDSLTAGNKEGSATDSVLAVDDISAAFREALVMGTDKVTRQLGKTDGFNADPLIHIPLPDQLQTVKSVLSTVGMANYVDELELKLNRAAEAAVPQTGALFLDSIKSMSFEDAMAIYRGPDDSATQYFKARMSPELKTAMLPVIDASLAEVDALQSYDRLMGEYQALPFVPDVKADLTQHVLNSALDGVFLYLSKEEAAIRNDPINHTSDLLKRVFGG